MCTLADLMNTASSACGGFVLLESGMTDWLAAPAHCWTELQHSLLGERALLGCWCGEQCAPTQAMHCGVLDTGVCVCVAD